MPSLITSRPIQRRTVVSLSFTICITFLLQAVHSLSLPPQGEDSTNGLTRRDTLFVASAAAASYGYAKAVEQAFCCIDYPEEHEERVRSVSQMTLSTAAKVRKDETLRVLEVGIGTAARLLRRGLYEFPPRVPIDITGLDVRIPTDPKIIEDIHLPDRVTLRTVQSSITESTLSDGSFDAILCCFTLCSVEDPTAAVSEIHRLLRPDGGVFGFVEHVGAPSGGWLARQQAIFDPLQQIVAQNCHLCRHTGATIAETFGGGEFLQYEEFMVDSMWPVSYQASGVIQRMS